jgi:hypothetical protein
MQLARTAHSDILARWKACEAEQAQGRPSCRVEYYNLGVEHHCEVENGSEAIH